MLMEFTGLMCCMAIISELELLCHVCRVHMHWLPLGLGSLQACLLHQNHDIDVLENISVHGVQQI